MDVKSFSQNLLLFPLLLFVLWQTGSCHGENPVNDKTRNRVAVGVWGGQNLNMEVTETGAQLQFSCSHGTVDEPLMLDGKGQFSASGSITAEGPGPIRDPPKKQAATYTGRVQDKTMQLTVKLGKTDRHPGNYTLEFGKPGRVRRCY